MTKGKIRLRGPRAATVRSTSLRAQEVPQSLVAERLGAERVGPRQLLRPETASLEALRLSLFASIRSTGGRPGLAGANVRQRVPMSSSDWALLEDLAAQLRNGEVNPTPGQIAGQLLHHTLVNLRQSDGSSEYPLNVSARALGVSDSRRPTELSGSARADWSADRRDHIGSTKRRRGKPGRKR